MVLAARRAAEQVCEKENAVCRIFKSLIIIGQRRTIFLARGAPGQQPDKLLCIQTVLSLYCYIAEVHAYSCVSYIIQTFLLIL